MQMFLIIDNFQIGLSDCCLPVRVRRSGPQVTSVLRIKASQRSLLFWKVNATAASASEWRRPRRMRQTVRHWAFFCQSLSATGGGNGVISGSCPASPAPPPPPVKPLVSQRSLRDIGSTGAARRLVRAHTYYESRQHQQWKGRGFIQQLASHALCWWCVNDVLMIKLPMLLIVDKLLCANWFVDKWIMVLAYDRRKRFHLQSIKLSIYQQ